EHGGITSAVERGHCCSLCCSLQFAHHLAAKAVDCATTAVGHQLDLAALARLETHGGAGGDVQMHAACLRAVEAQGWIGFEEVIVRPDLDRAVAGVFDT